MEEKYETACWWKEAVVYQIYPRSFQDSNGDGIGDLRGIAERLDYVKSLGVDVLWLNPIFASPNDDNGYDISDYRNIMKDFGTMDDFDFLLGEVHQRGLRIVLDLVVNHTSDEHPWFTEARKSRNSPYYRYYHWWPLEKGRPPLRKSYFDKKGNAWCYNPKTRSWYLHYFSRKQPDLNWENPEVRKQIFDMMNFWFEKGIDGFRMDSISYISKDITFPEIDRRKYPGVFEYYAHGPHLHDYLHEMNRSVLSHYDCMSVGEGSNVGPEDVFKFVEPVREELNMLYHFGAAGVRNSTPPDSPGSGIDYSLIALKKMFALWDKAVGNGWPAIYLGNHDQPRMVSRFGNDHAEFRNISAKMLTTFLLTMRGTPYWFAGDEIGMCNIKFDRIEDYNDIDTRNHYFRIEKRGGNTLSFIEKQKHLSRDNARTPCQWDDSENAGFTKGSPWLKINPDYMHVNVKSQEQNPDSVLNYFKKVVAYRKKNKGLIYGNCQLLDENNEQVYAYFREGEGQKFLIVLNFSPQQAIAYAGHDLSEWEIVLNNYGDRQADENNGNISLLPYQAIVWKAGRQ